jgi:hypothetical protein
MYCTNSGQLHPRILNNSLTGVKYAQIFFPYPIFHRNSMSRPWQGAGSTSYKLDRGVQEREGGNDQKLEIRKATIFAKLLRCGSHLTVRA